MPRPWEGMSGGPVTLGIEVPRLSLRPLANLVVHGLPTWFGWLKLLGAAGGNSGSPDGMTGDNGLAGSSYARVAPKRAEVREAELGLKVPPLAAQFRSNKIVGSHFNDWTSHRHSGREHLCSAAC